MFDPKGPFSQDLCDQILVEVADKRKSEKTKHLASIKNIAESLGYDKAEIKNNAEYLILIKHLSGGLGGNLSLTRTGAAIVNKLLDES